MGDGAHSHCSVCPTMACCVEYAVTITGRDAYLIAGQTRLPIEAFTYYFEQPRPNEFGFVLSPGGPPHDLALAKRLRGTALNHSPCAFLMDLPGGVQRCGIYPFRPLVCRNYPATQHREVVQFRRTNKCPARSYDLSKVEVRHWLPGLLEARFEHDLYENLVVRWNRRVDARPAGPVPVSEYYAFLLSFYHRTQLLRPLDARTWARVLSGWNRQLDRGLSPLEHTAPEQLPRDARDQSELWRLASSLREVLAQF